MNNLGIIKSLYKYFAEGNTDAIRYIFSTDIEWEQMDGFPNGGRYIGADDIFEHVFAGFGKYWTGWHAQVDEFIEAGNYVFAIGFYKGTYNATQKSISAAFIHRYTIQEGKITHFKQYTDTKVVADAMN